MVVGGLGVSISRSSAVRLGQHPLTALSLTIFPIVLAFLYDRLLGAPPVGPNQISGRRLPESSLTQLQRQGVSRYI